MPDAICYVPRTVSIQQEYRRKVRTITRGMETLWHKRALMNPLRYGGFALMLLSHKVCRWLLPWLGLGAWAATAILALRHTWALVLFALGTAILLLAAVGWRMAVAGKGRSRLALLAFVVAGNLAAVHALLRVAHGDRSPTGNRRDGELPTGALAGPLEGAAPAAAPRPPESPKPRHTAEGEVFSIGFRSGGRPSSSHLPSES